MNTRRYAVVELQRLRRVVMALAGVVGAILLLFFAIALFVNGFASARAHHTLRAWGAANAVGAAIYYFMARSIVPRRK